MTLHRLFWLGALVATNAGAATEAPAPMALAPGLIQATLGLAVVIAMIWGAAWLTRKLSPTTSSSRSPIKLLATQAVGQRERVVLVEFGDNWLLLGVAPGRVNTLHIGPKSALPQAAGTETTPFAKLLALTKRGKEN